MKIFIDAQPTLRQKSGIGYYTYNLIKFLQKIDKKNQYKLIFWRSFSKNKSDLITINNSNFSYRFINFPLKVYTKLLKFNVKFPIKNLGNPDIYLFSNFIYFPITKSKSIITIYDLSFLKYPGFSEPKNVAFLKKLVPISIKKADHIVTISENSKKEIMKVYKVPSEKISIVYPAVNYQIFKPMDEESTRKVKKEYQLNKDYFLFASTLEPRKNIIGIIKAYISLPEEIKNKYELVLAGGKGWQDQEILEVINKTREAGNKIITPGYMPEKDLPALYSGAYLFLYPSFYEGFGIPILEAMACGTPVITSNTSSMPEVAGDAALLVNPENIEEIKEGIIKITSNSNLRNNLIKKGLDQAKKFSWTKSAQRLIEVFEKVNRASQISQNSNK